MNIFQKRTVGKKESRRLLASQLLFTAGCGSGEQRETAGQLDTEQTMQQDGYIVVGYVQVGSNPTGEPPTHSPLRMCSRRKTATI